MVQILLKLAESQYLVILKLPWRFWGNHTIGWFDIRESAVRTRFCFWQNGQKWCFGVNFRVWDVLAPRVSYLVTVMTLWRVHVEFFRAQKPREGSERVPFTSHFRTCHFCVLTWLVKCKSGKILNNWEYCICLTNLSEEWKTCSCGGELWKRWRVKKNWFESRLRHVCFVYFDSALFFSFCWLVQSSF
jgi:hypothetical protein